MSSVHEESGEQANPVLLIKGKRTKRKRSESALMNSAVVSSVCSGERSSMEAREEGEAGGEVVVRKATDEDEDMANCLVLLSQRDAEKSDKKQVASLGLGLDGAYQCKTCDKSFNSYQALGGHIGSHKRLRESVFNIALAVEKEEAAGAVRSFLSSDGSKKRHECWICKAVLPSGQSLGGHMRNHRGFTNAISTSSSSSSTHHNEESERPKKRLLLDLNLPAPEYELQYAFLSKDQILRFVAETKSFTESQSLMK